MSILQVGKRYADKIYKTHFTIISVTCRTDGYIFVGMSDLGSIQFFDENGHTEREEWTSSFYNLDVGKPLPPKYQLNTLSK